MRLRSIYLFRHGETDWNAEGRFQGQLDVPLNDRGRAQARALAESLRDAGLGAILSSDLSRARETAEIVARALGRPGEPLPIVCHRGLREAHLGDAQGKLGDEIAAAFGEESVRAWRSGRIGDGDLSYPGGETGHQVRARTLAALRELLKAHAHPVVGVSSHGGVIRRLVASLLPEGSAAIPIPNTVVYRLSYDEAADKLAFIGR